MPSVHQQPQLVEAQIRAEVEAGSRFLPLVPGAVAAVMAAVPHCSKGDGGGGNMGT